MVSKKISDSVSERFRYQKKYLIRYRKEFGIEKVSESVSKIFGSGKRFGFGFVQILGIVTDWLAQVWREFVSD